MIPPNDSQALVEAMNELWNNEETSNRYGENSRRRFEEMFTADHMIDALCQSLHYIAGKQILRDATPPLLRGPTR